MDGMGVVTGSGGMSAHGGRASAVSLELRLPPSGSAQILCRMGADDLAALFGAGPGADLALLARNFDVDASVTAGGISISNRGQRPRLGKPIATPASGDSGDWVLGPITVTRVTGDLPVKMFRDWAQQGLTPLAWRSLSCHLMAGHLAVPDPFTISANVSAGELPSPSRRSSRRAARVDPRQTTAEEEPPLLAAIAEAARRPAEADHRIRRHRVARERLSQGDDGRLGLTLPDSSMQLLWAGRAASEARACILAPLGSDILVIPADDPTAGHIGGVPLVVRPGSEGRWYGRTAKVSTTVPKLESVLRAGKEFQVELQPGRVLLKGALKRSEGTAPTKPASVTAVSAGHPAALRLAKARQLISDALALVRDARSAGRAQIELLDESGVCLVCVPDAASAARIRIEV